MKKRETKIQRAWIATAAMQAPSGNCGGAHCTQAPTVRIGRLLLCADCLERARTAYPASFNAYWAAQVRPLADGA